MNTRRMLNLFSQKMINLLLVDNWPARDVLEIIRTATLQDGSLKAIHKASSAVQSFERGSSYTTQEVLGTLQKGGMISEGLPGRLHFYWLNFTGIEYEDRAWLHFRKKDDGRYETDYTQIGGVF